MIMAQIVNAIHVCVREDVCVHDNGWNRECNSGCYCHCIRFDHVVFEGMLIMIVIVPSIQ